MKAEKTILIVDEDKPNIEMLKSGFEKMKFQVCAKNQLGFNLESLDRFWPNYAIIDMYLPTTRGMDFCKALSKKFPGIHLLLMTREQTLDLNMELMQEYVYDYLVKPFKFIQAYAAIHRAEKDLDLEEKYRLQSLMIEKLKQENQVLKKTADRKPISEKPTPPFPPVDGIHPYNQREVRRESS